MNLRIGNRICNVLKTVMFLMLMFAAPTTAFAQAAQAELTGAVTDAGGASVAGAQVRLTEIATGAERETVTDAGGAFVFTNQKPGVYRVSFQAAGFNELVRGNVTLTTGERIRLDETLAVAPVQNMVTVSSDAPLLRSETSSLGQFIDNKFIAPALRYLTEQS